MWRKIAFLTYKQHGGSGTNLTLSEVMELDWHRMEWWITWLEEQRSREESAIRAAHNRSRG